MGLAQDWPAQTALTSAASSDSWLTSAADDSDRSINPAFVSCDLINTARDSSSCSLSANKSPDTKDSATLHVALWEQRIQNMKEKQTCRVSPNSSSLLATTAQSLVVCASSQTVCTTRSRTQHKQPRPCDGARSRPSSRTGSQRLLLAYDSCTRRETKR